VPSDADVFHIKQRAEAALFAIPGVTAVGIGGRERDGRATGELVLKVYVDAKRPLEELAPAEVVPAEFEGLPTDVSVLPPEGTSTEVPMGRAEVPIADADDRRQRPLIGGSQIQSAVSGVGTGTLGGFLVDAADAAKVYALTNYHVLRSKSVHPTVGTTKAGQPTNRDSSTRCCSAIVGTFAGGGEAVRDAALVRLDPGTQWKAEILEIGAVRGTHTITVAEAATGTFAVRKRGARSGLTGGTVDSIGTTWTIEGQQFTNLIVVRPTPDPSLPAGRRIYFQQGGDSGALLVDDAAQVVGLMKAKGDVSANVSVGAAIAIENVLNGFQTNEAITATVATATTTGVVNTVPGSAMVALPVEALALLDPAGDRYTPGGAQQGSQGVPIRVPVGSETFGDLGLEPRLALARVQRDLDRSETGRFLICLWLGHQDELLRLINENRRVAAVWHRSGASALVGLLARMVGQPEVALPETLHGHPVRRTLEQMREVLLRFGSPRLRADLERAQDALPDPGGRTYPQLIAALGGR